MGRMTKVLFTVAASSYGANCALGSAVALRIIDTSGWRWIHHAVYIATVTTSVAAFLAGLARDRRAALLLAPAAVPLAMIPRVSARTRGHVVLAASAAPFIAGGVVSAWR